MRRSSLTLLLAMVLSSAPLSAQQTQVSVESEGQETVVRMTIGASSWVVQATADGVEQARAFDIPGGGGGVVWQEVGAVTTPWFALSQNGGELDRVTATSYELALRYARFDPLRDGAPPVPPGLDSNLGGRLWIVQYWTQGLEQYRDAVRALGGADRLFLPYHANVVEMDAATAASVSSLPFVRWVGSYHPAYKLDEALLLADASGAGRAQAVNILALRRGAGPQAEISRRIEQLGGRVDHLSPKTFLMRATLTPAQIMELSRLDVVQWIDPWGPPEPDMNIARQFLGADYVLTTGSFDGTGVRGEVMDVGTQINHPEWSGREIIHGTVPNGSHGTSCTGIIFASGNTPQARGVCFNGVPILANYQNFAGGSRAAHTAELVNPNLSFQAVFQSNSWGSVQTTQYTSASQDMDQIIFDTDLVICQSQSNTGTQASRPQAWAKNIVSGGGINHQNTLSKQDDAWAGGGSVGPAADGRIKPTLSAFYDQIFTTTSGSGYTQSFGGTSGATPMVAGSFGLFFQMWHGGNFGNATSTSVFASRPKSTLARAVMIATASQWSFNGLSHDLTRTNQGWGHPDLQKLWDNRNLIHWVNETDVLQNLQSTTYSLTVPGGVPELKVALVYMDPPGTPGAAFTRINNLDVRVTSPTGAAYWGNNGLRSSNYSAPGGSADTADTVECVFVANPSAGTWTFEVIAAEVNQDSHLETSTVDADYALAILGVTPGPQPFGLEFSSSGAADLHLGLNYVPAGTTQGYCVFSLATALPAGMGPLFGLLPDSISFISLTTPLAPGNPLHWAWPVSSIFPASDLNLPPGAVPFPSGTSADGVGFAVGPGSALLAITPVLRVTF